MKLTPVGIGVILSAAAMAQIQNQPDDGLWPMAAKNYASTRYSTLDQVNTQSVKNLKLAFTFSTGVTHGHEAAPLVVNNAMYVVTPYPNILFALDLTKPGAPLKWSYQPKPVPASQGVACCDVVNRGAAYADGKIFCNTLGAQTVAVDANTGAEVWRTKLGDINRGESITIGLTGAIAWFASLCISFAAVGPGCADRSKILLLAIPIAAIAVTGVAAAASWRRWRARGGDFPGQAAVAGHRALASGGVLLNAFFVIVLVAQMIVPGVLGVCQ